MNIHFICRGNVLRSLIAETYLRSLHIHDVNVISSGTNVDITDQTEQIYFMNTLRILKRHGIYEYAKATSHQLTMKRASGQDVTICMNQRVVDEASLLVDLPSNTISWDITDIGEGNRTHKSDREKYEEEIYSEIVTKVDQLVSDLKLQSQL